MAPAALLSSNEPIVDVASRLAGAGAIACGQVTLRQNSFDSMTCAHKQLSLKKPFWVAVQIQGEDSHLWRAAAQSVDGRKWMVLFDSDISGNSSGPHKPLLEVVPCEDLEIVPNKRLGISCPSYWR
jgi:hypothetical protein